MCQVPKCRSRDHDLTFYGKQICESCWIKYSNGELDLKSIFKVKEPIIVKEHFSTQHNLKRYSL